MDFLKAFLGRLGAWLQALGVGALVALQQYLSTASPDQGDPVSSLLTGLILSGLVKLLGALIARFGPQPTA